MRFSKIKDDGGIFWPLADLIVRKSIAPGGTPRPLIAPSCETTISLIPQMEEFARQMPRESTRLSEVLIVRKNFPLISQIKVRWVTAVLYRSFSRILLR